MPYHSKPVYQIVHLSMSFVKCKYYCVYVSLSRSLRMGQKENENEKSRSIRSRFRILICLYILSFDNNQFRVHCRKTKTLVFRFLRFENSLLTVLQGVFPLQTYRRAKEREKKWWLHIKIQRTHCSLRSFALFLVSVLSLSCSRCSYPLSQSHIRERGDREWVWERKTEGMKNGILYKRERKKKNIPKWTEWTNKRINERRISTYYILLLSPTPYIT